MIYKFFKQNKVFLFISAGFIVGWMLYFYFGHMLIRAIYEGRSMGVLNNIITGQAMHPLSLYFKQADLAFINFNCLYFGTVVFLYLVKLAKIIKIIKYFIYFLVCFFVLHVFMLQWGFLENSKGHSIKNMLNYTSERPWAYRVLTPMIINSTSQFVLKSKLYLNENWLIKESPIIKYYAKDKESLDVALNVKYHFIFLYLLTSLVLLLLSVRYLTKIIYSFPSLVSDLAPPIALLFLPLTFLHGGFFYDFPELLFMAIYLICLVKKKWPLLYAVYFLAILNKESNVLLIVYFIAFYTKKFSSKDFIKHLIMHTVIGGLLLILVRSIFITNAGSPIQNHLIGNITFWTTPKNYFLFFDGYRLGLDIFPRGLNILSIIFMFFLVFYKWKEKPFIVKRLFICTSIVNVPLFIFGGYADEIRNLSLIFPSLYLLGVHSVYSFILKHETVDKIYLTRKI